MATPAVEMTGKTGNLTPAENKDRYRKLYIDDLWNGGNLDILPEIIHKDTYYHPPSFQDPTRYDDMAGIIQGFHNAFPNGSFSFVIDEMIAEDDLVFVQLSFEGKQHDEFCGVPSSGKTLKFTVAGWYRFKEGRIIECRKYNVGDNHDFISAMGIREQLGN